MSDNHLSRRQLLGDTITVAGIAGLGGLTVFDQLIAKPLAYLDSNSYVNNMTLHGHFMDGRNRGTKFQLMACGSKRYLFQGGKPPEPCLVFDISNPLKPVLVSQDQFVGFQIQLAYNHHLKKWILITGSAPGMRDLTRGKGRQKAGLRGVRIYDASDPANVRLLTMWSCDQGDPAREVQKGSGTHRNYYDGGRYAYLDTGPDNSYVNYEIGRANGVQIIDVSHPSSPKFVANWWVPGMREGENEYHQWREYGDGRSFTSLHGPFMVPRKVEEGGRYAYSAWGSFGLLIHDLKDVRKPRLVGQWRPKPKNGPGGIIQFHLADASRVEERGFVIVSPEPLIPECNHTRYDSYVLDVQIPEKPTLLATLPIPVPPESAPYKDFCNKRGRFGTHNSPHQKAPGKRDPNFTCYTYFNGGLQCYDISNSRKPHITAYFVPKQGGDLAVEHSYFRDADNVMVEWDRKIIWLASNTGIYLLSTPELGEPVLKSMPVNSWSLPGLNSSHSQLATS